MLDFLFKLKLQLVQQIIINENHPYYKGLDYLCFLSKNLYNTTLYNIRQYYKETGKYLDYYAINKLFRSTNNIDYISIPYVQSAQQVLKQVDSQYKAFYQMIKSDKMKNKKIHISKYKDKENGRNILIYTNQGFIHKGNEIKLKGIEGQWYTIITDKQNIQQVRLIPKSNNHIVIEIVYNKEYELKEDNKRYASIDLGLNNLCTLVSNVSQSIIYDGKKLKSINQYYNKKKAELRSKLDKQNIKSSKRIRLITNRRNNKVKDYLHKISTSIIQYMETNQLNTLIVGKNIGWKEGIELGKKCNQNFVSIPYDTLIKMLEYKCKLHGIKMIIVNEAYTSKCSFLDNETICKHDLYLGSRIKRGLFISNKGIKLNADVNGAYNILRLGLKSLNVKCDVSDLIPTYKRFMYNPYRFLL